MSLGSAFRRHAAGVLMLMLAACGPRGLAGTYEDETGMTRYEFQRNGTALLSVLGTTVAAEYRLDGDRVLVTSPQGTVVLTRRDGRLFGPMGLELSLTAD